MQSPVLRRLFWISPALVADRRRNDTVEHNTVCLTLSSAAGTIANQAGVAPIIPGVDIPLFAGIISIAILLIIHEFSHGILAKKAKVKLKEIGLLVFGFIPIGGLCGA